MMTYEARYLIAIILVLVVLGILLIFRRIRQSGNIKSHSYGMPRLAVLDDARIDQNRRLILVRRDNVEHLLLIGGTTDVVVEQYAVQDGNPDRSVHIGAIDGVEKGVEKIESKERLQIDRKSELSNFSDNWDNKSKTGDSPGNYSNNKSVEKIPPAIDKLLNSQSNSTDSPKDETEAKGKPETPTKNVESLVNKNFTSDFRGKRPDFNTDTSNEAGRIESEVTSSIPEVSKPAIGEREDREESRSAPDFSSNIFQSSANESVLETATVKEPVEESPTLSNLSEKAEKRGTVGDKSESASWLTQTDSENKSASPAIDTVSGQQESPVTSPTEKPTRSFLSSLNEPEVEEDSHAGPVGERTQLKESQSTGLGADPVKAESGQTENLQQTGQQGGADGGEGMEKPKKSDSDVFDTIGEEMTKILQELRKNSNSPPAASN